VPSGRALDERLPGVLAVLYLLFTQGYNADGEPAFADEAIRLARLLSGLMPDQPEPAALLALFLFQHSRRAARRDADGALVPLDRQDRDRWDRAAIGRGGGAAATDYRRARTDCRRASPPATPPRTPPGPPTGRGSPSSMTGS
jgi:RNA polymerase sigma-70 factor (ECF subfamily)